MCGRATWISNKFIIISAITVNTKWVHNDGTMQVLPIDFISVTNPPCESPSYSVNSNISLHLYISLVK